MHFTRGGMVGKYDHIYIYTYIYIYIYRERERERETWDLGSLHACLHALSNSDIHSQTHDYNFLSIETHSYFPLNST